MSRSGHLGRAFSDILKVLVFFHPFFFSQINNQNGQKQVSSHIVRKQEFGVYNGFFACFN